MKAETLKSLVSLLLLASAVLHFVTVALGAPADIKLGLAIFGGAYFALGVWTRRGGRTAMLAALIVTVLGVSLGGASFLQRGGPPLLPVMFVVDALVIAGAGAWLFKTKSPR